MYQKCQFLSSPYKKNVYMHPTLNKRSTYDSIITDKRSILWTENFIPTGFLNTVITIYIMNRKFHAYEFSEHSDKCLNLKHKFLSNITWLVAVPTQEKTGLPRKKDIRTWWKTQIMKMSCSKLQGTNLEITRLSFNSIEMPKIVDAKILLKQFPQKRMTVWHRQHFPIFLLKNYKRKY